MEKGTKEQETKEKGTEKESNSFLDAAIAAAIAEFITLPICTIKTNYQNYSYRSILNVTKRIYQRSGLLGFYNASAPAILSQSITTAIRYGTYQHIKTYLEEKFPGQKIVLPVSGLCSGIIASVVVHPLDVAKVHKQMATPISDVIKRHGWSVLYRGYSKSIGKCIIGSTLFYPLTDYFTEKTDSKVLGPMLGSIVGTIGMQPMDYLKTRHMYGNSLYTGNLSQYYRGLTVNLTRIVPHFTIMMTIISMKPWSSIQSMVEKYT